MDNQNPLRENSSSSELYWARMPPPCRASIISINRVTYNEAERRRLINLIKERYGIPIDQELTPSEISNIQPRGSNEE